MTLSSFKSLLDIYNHDYKVSPVKMVCFYLYVFIHIYSASLIQTWNKWKDEFNWLVILSKGTKGKGGIKK